MLVHCHAGCDQQAVIDALKTRGLWPEREELDQRPRAERPPPKPKQSTGWPALNIWRESVDPRGTWAEYYLASRNTRHAPAGRPGDAAAHAALSSALPVRDGERVPALVCAFTPILAEVPDDPFLDPPPVAIHRIRGRGHATRRCSAR